MTVTLFFVQGLNHATVVCTASPKNRTDVARLEQNHVHGTWYNISTCKDTLILATFLTKWDFVANAKDSYQRLIKLCKQKKVKYTRVVPARPVHYKTPKTHERDKITDDQYGNVFMSPQLNIYPGWQFLTTKPDKTKPPEYIKPTDEDNFKTTITKITQKYCNTDFGRPSGKHKRIFVFK